MTHMTFAERSTCSGPSVQQSPLQGSWTWPLCCFNCP